MRVLMSVGRRHHTFGKAIAEAIGALRARLRVSVVTPESFEEELARLRPKVVICDQPGPEGTDGTLAWVEFFVGADRPSEFRVGGRRRKIIDPAIIELLAVVDEALTLARTTPVVA